MMVPHSRPFTGEDEIEAVARVLRSGQLAQGPEVAAFEVECAALVGRRHAVAVNSGTAALHLALLVLGIGEKSRVAIPSYACAALAQAIGWQRAEPALCDIGADFNLDLACVPVDTQAVILPHLFGARAALPKTGLVIEDIAQSIGGPTGKAGVVAIASFHATKLCATGEGGMLLTDDPALAAEARDRRDYDNRDDFKTRFAYKMTDLQAAIGRVQLRRLPEFIARRREIAQRYTDAFAAFPMTLPGGAEHVYFRYVVRTSRRDALETHLESRGIAAKRPVYRPAHHYFGGDFPWSQAAHQQALSLPIYPGLLPAEESAVIECVVRFWEHS